MATVKIPRMLRPLVGGESTVTVEGPTLRAAIQELDAQHPGFAGQLLDGQSGDLRSFVNLYLNDEDARYLGGLETPVGPNDVISILPAVAGGAEAAGGASR